MSEPVRFLFVCVFIYLFLIIIFLNCGGGEGGVKYI